MLKDLLLEIFRPRTMAQRAASRRAKAKRGPTQVDAIHMHSQARIAASNKQREEDDTEILNPDTGNMITVGTALHMPPESAAHRAAVARRKPADENINELSPEKYSSYHQTARMNKTSNIQNFHHADNDTEEQNYFDKAAKREKGIKRAAELSQKKVKNPKTGKEIQATSALKKDHPANVAAKSALAITKEDKVNELSPETLARYIPKAASSATDHSKAHDVERQNAKDAKKKEPRNYDRDSAEQKANRAGDEHSRKAYRRSVGVKRATNALAKKTIKNPKTGKEIQATSAAAKDHPAHAAYVSAVNEDKTTMLSQKVKYKNADGTDGEGTVKSLLGYAKDHPGRKAAARVYAQFMGNQAGNQPRAGRISGAELTKYMKNPSRTRYNRGDDDDYDRMRDADTEDGIYETSLVNMLKESAGNRIETNKLKTIIDKITPTLSEPKQEKLTEMFVEFLACVFKVNSEPYGIFTSQATKMEVFLIALKVEAMKEFLCKEHDPKKDNAQLITVGLKALDELFEY